MSLIQTFNRSHLRRRSRTSHSCFLHESWHGCAQQSVLINKTSSDIIPLQIVSPRLKSHWTKCVSGSSISGVPTGVSVPYVRLAKRLMLAYSRQLSKNRKRLRLCTRLSNHALARQKARCQNYRFPSNVVSPLNNGRMPVRHC